MYLYVCVCVCDSCKCMMYDFFFSNISLVFFLPSFFSSFVIHLKIEIFFCKSLYNINKKYAQFVVVGVSFPFSERKTKHKEKTIRNIFFEDVLKHILIVLLCWKIVFVFFSPLQSNIYIA